jgi:predicted CXXCH cytochrome family protein
MNCHSNIRKDAPEIAKIKEALEKGTPIEWTKVHHLADFVYFNHAQHVAVGKVSCQECHGPVENMMRMRQDAPLTMGWCLDCHRSHDVAVHGTTEPKKVSDMGGTDCARCHY